MFASAARGFEWGQQYSLRTLFAFAAYCTGNVAKPGIARDVADKSIPSSKSYTSRKALNWTYLAIELSCLCIEGTGAKLENCVI